MRAAPKDASGSPPEAAADIDRRRLPAARRLRSPAQFAAVTSDPKALRAARRWLAVTGRIRPDRGPVPVRFGFTVARRLARRAVDRNTVKRVMREAARQQIAILDAAAADRSVDIVLRLKSAAADAGSLGRTAWKAALRAEADALLEQLRRTLSRRELR